MCNPKELLTTGQAAEKIGVSRQAILKSINGGNLKAYWVLGQWAIDPVHAEKAKAKRTERLEKAC